MYGVKALLLLLIAFMSCFVMPLDCLFDLMNLARLTGITVNFSPPHNTS